MGTGTRVFLFVRRNLFLCIPHSLSTHPYFSLPSSSFSPHYPLLSLQQLSISLHNSFASGAWEGRHSSVRGASAASLLHMSGVTHGSCVRWACELRHLSVGGASLLRETVTPDSVYCVTAAWEGRHLCEGGALEGSALRGRDISSIIAA